jgi:hypothetical protein
MMRGEESEDAKLYARAANRKQHIEEMPPANPPNAKSSPGALVGMTFRCTSDDRRSRRYSVLNIDKAARKGDIYEVQFSHRHSSTLLTKDRFDVLQDISSLMDDRHGCGSDNSDTSDNLDDFDESDF